MDDVKVEQIYLEDGREAERHVKEEGDERVLELYVEPPKPVPVKNLEKRVIEKRRPVVYERVIETIEGDKVLDRKVEAIDPKVEMKLLEHHVAAQPKVEAQAIAEAPREEEKEYVTKEDLQKAILAAVKAVKKQRVVEEPVAEEEPAEEVPTKLSMQQVVGERVQKSNTATLINIGLGVLIAAQVGALGYLLFWM